MTSNVNLDSIKRVCNHVGINLEFCMNLPFEYKSYDKFKDWKDEGKHGSMQWIEKKSELSEYLERYPWARSILGFSLKYYGGPIPKEILNDPNRGIIARYAWGRDYHKVLRKRLNVLKQVLNNQCVQAVQKVDTAPILERDLFNQFVGQGFVGRNSMFIHKDLGSYTNLALLITDCDKFPNTINEFKPNEKLIPGSRCGNCRLCIDKCPSNAILEDGTIDARICISYLTIEHKGPIPKKLWPMMRNRIFGCDICQEVCPYNKDEVEDIDWDRFCPKLSVLESLTEEEFRERFKGTPVIRAGYDGFMRNVQIAIFNRDNYDRQIR